ncbi:MAG: MBL fold metallo-hydrolase, partial [Chloroflexi bacterium]|nr:MBL fold metallo-hydrolase [Chloroflexota bacterium]
ASNEAQREPRFAELRRHGCPEDVIARLAALRGTRSLRWAPCPAAAMDTVASEREIALAGSETLRVIPAPGHTPGNLVAFVPERGDLYSGDTILPTTIPTAGLHFPAAVNAALAVDAARWPSLPPFLRSVAALRALPVRRVLPGHGDVVTDPDTLFERFAVHHARRARRVRDALASGPTTAYAIARGIFPRLPAERIGQAVTEVLGHLDVLAEQGEAAADADAGGMVEWRLV